MTDKGGTVVSVPPRSSPTRRSTGATSAEPGIEPPDEIIEQLAYTRAWWPELMVPIAEVTVYRVEAGKP